MAKAEYVWFETVDRGAWSVGVERTDDNNGMLVVIDNGSEQIVHAEPVTLAYSARFGPDVDDVNFWSERVIQVIDDPYQRSIAI